MKEKIEEILGNEIGAGQYSQIFGISAAAEKIEALFEKERAKYREALGVVRDGAHDAGIIKWMKAFWGKTDE